MREAYIDTVSVVVPVYNTKEYIVRCIESIICQTYQWIEVILIDDGSNDGSEIICDEYARGYENITVFHQQNKGQAMARSKGVSIAKGQYIMFVDSDDYIDNNLIESLMNRIVIEETDLVVSYLLYEEENSLLRSDVYIEDGTYGKADILNQLIDHEVLGGTGMPVSLCGKIFIRNKLINAFSRIKKRFIYGEDLVGLLFYIEEAQSITFVSQWGYHYINRCGSTSHSVSFSYFKEIKELDDYIKEECEKKQSNMELYKQAQYFIRYLLVETMQGIFPDIDIGFISFVPPFELIPPGCRLAIYGSGRVGKSMVKSLLQSNLVTIVGWYDRKYGESVYSIEIEAPEKINSSNFECILIAVAVKDYMIQIKDQLEKMGIPGEKIIWKRPYSG